MPPLRILSAAEQVAEHLRAELSRGRWSGELPGVKGLAAELGVSPKTIVAALGQLEQDGVLVGQGPRRRRRIKLDAGATAGGSTARPLRVATLLHEESDRKIDYIAEIQHRLAEAGHRAFFPAKSLVELGMRLPRLHRLVETCEADAWVVCAGSREVLEWFAARPTPLFALFGRLEGQPVAGIKPDKRPALAAAVRHLVGLGHRRVVLLAHGIRRLPVPGRSERAFLEELESHGIATSPYNLPDWEATPHGLHQVLDGLFRATPPTALILDKAAAFVATLGFLAAKGLRVPGDVSLVSTDPDPSFSWCQPPVTHIRWDSEKVVRRIVRWATNVGSGKKDRRQTLTEAEFVDGGTIGPVAKG